MQETTYDPQETTHSSEISLNFRGLPEGFQLEFMEKEGRKKTLRRVKYDDCVISRFNSRKTRSEENIMQLAHRIERNGYEVTRALWGYYENGKYEIFAGGSRLEAAGKTSYRDKIPLFLHEGYTDEEIVQLEARDNEDDEYHVKVSIVDVWTEYARLRDEERWTQERIAKAKGCDRTQVSRRLKFHDELPVVIKEHVNQEKLTERHLQEITVLRTGSHFSSWLTTEQFWIDLAEIAVEKKLSVSKLKKEVERKKKLIAKADELYQKLDKEIKIGDEIYEPREIYVSALADEEVDTQKGCDDVYTGVIKSIETKQREYERELEWRRDEAKRMADELETERIRIELQQRYEPQLYFEAFNPDRLSDNSVKMIITSPEYYSPTVWNHEATLEEYVNEQVNLFVSMKSKLQDNVILCVNVNDLRDEQTNMVYPYSMLFARKMIENGFYLRDEIIWNKIARPPANSNLNLTDYKEFVFVFVLHPEIEVNIKAINDEEVTDRGNMWIISPDNRDDDTKIFPFPEKLVEYCLLYGSEIDDLILDPFLGLGTTCCVCKRMKRRSIGFERNTDMANVVKQRLDNMEGEGGAIRLRGHPRKC